MRRTAQASCRAVTALVVLTGVGVGPEVHAAGLFLAPRGVRPLAMAGSYIAGADDVNALSYNPAGLAGATETVQLDAAVPWHATTYTRSIQGDGVYETSVEGRGASLPSPTLGVVHGLGIDPGLRFGLALTADYPLMQNWPGAATDAAAPQRYAAGNTRGTALSKVIAGAGYELAPWLRVGASVQVLVGRFASTNTASACDGVICTQPEDPAYDVVLQMRATGIAVPGAQLGIIAEPVPWARVGLSWESGYTIDSPARFSVRLPSAPAYDAARLDPGSPQGRVRLALPQVLRAGVMMRPTSDTRVEGAFVWEPWSAHDRISVDLGGARVHNLLGVGDFSMAGMQIPQGFRDTWSARLGGEWRPPVLQRALTVRAGTLYEPAAVPPAHLTARAVDLDKVMAAAGAQLSFGPWHVEATYAHMFMLRALVTQSQMYQVNPTQADRGALTPVGNGIYEANAHLFGLGARYDI